MQDRIMISSNKIQAIAAAINEKAGDSVGMTLDEMPDKIRAISSGGDGAGARVIITTETEEFFNQPVTLTNGMDTMTTNFSSSGEAVFNDVKMEGVLTASVTDGDITVETTTVVQTSYNISLDAEQEIYGVLWDGSSSPVFTRTDLATDFPDAVAYKGGGNYNSPFDNIYPWSEMIKEEDEDCGTMVKIPKFYYKMDKTGDSLKLQIAPRKYHGFRTCPACADRGDGHGERDYILVSRYFCSQDTYKSQTGTRVAGGENMSTLRTHIHDLGSNVYMFDYAALITIQMLYLVEFANWDVQSQIGWGCAGWNSDVNGGTDKHPYCTSSSGTAGRTWVQYRNIENLWSQALWFVDGIRYVGKKVYVYLNPSEYDDLNKGTYVGDKVTTDGYIKSFEPATISGYEWVLIPTDSTADETTSYVCDYIWYNQTDTRLSVGAFEGSTYTSYNDHGKTVNKVGLFHQDGTDEHWTSELGTARIMKLP